MHRDDLENGSLVDLLTNVEMFLLVWIGFGGFDLYVHFFVKCESCDGLKFGQWELMKKLNW